MFRSGIEYANLIQLRLGRRLARRSAPLSRSEIMARVKDKDTKPEMFVRRGLHGRGFRYLLHSKELPGRPDLTLPKYGTVIEIRGCFWHGHENCGRRPKSNHEFWNEKIDATVARDRRNAFSLRDLGWRTLVIWECAVVGPGRWSGETLIDAIVAWLRGGNVIGEFKAIDRR